MKSYWIVDEDGRDVCVTAGDDGYGRGDDDRTYRRVSDEAVRCLAWDPIEQAYEVIGEFDLHETRFSDNEMTLEP